MSSNPFLNLYIALSLCCCDKSPCIVIALNPSCFNSEASLCVLCLVTKQRTHRLASELKQEGFKAITMHGDLSQQQRDSAMYKFRKGFEDILVATDIAARGIDVPAVGHVINYDIPADPLIYFHRIGRTARAGGAGKAISLVSQDRVDDFG